MDVLKGLKVGHPLKTAQYANRKRINHDTALFRGSPHCEDAHLYVLKVKRKYWPTTIDAEMKTPFERWDKPESDLPVGYQMI